MNAVKHNGTGLRTVTVSRGNYMADAMAPAEAQYALDVQRATWGHLAPKARRVYRGGFLFAYTEWGDMTPIQSAFEDLPDSPWFFDDLNEFIASQCIEGREGQVWRFDGQYVKNNNGTCGFSGTMRRIACEGAHS